MGLSRPLALLATVACAPRSAPPVHRDAGDAGPRVDAAVVAFAGGAAGGHGGLRVTVTWPSAPAALRASPGYTACNTPRPARARIGTLHGVAGAVVVVEGGAADVAAAAAVRLTVRDCAIAPAVAVGAPLEIESQDEHDQAVTIERLGPAWTGTAAAMTMARAHLPVIGHAITTPLDPVGAWRVAVDGVADPAYVVAAARAGVTDDAGQRAWPTLAPGTYAVTAWLPPTPEQPAVRATATAVVSAGATADLTLTF